MKTDREYIVSYVASKYHYEITSGRRIKFDLRTKEGKKRSQFYATNRKELYEEALRIEKLREQRRANKYTFKGIFQNSLYLDYKKRMDVCKVYADHLNFINRNHWAESKQDFNILKVLMKHRNKTN